MLKHKFPKFVSILLCFLFLLQQSGFAQLAIELNIAGHLSAMANSLTADKFRPIHLRYLQYLPRDNSFKLFLDKGDQFPNFVLTMGKGLKQPADNPKLKEETQTLLNYFFIGLALPNSSFWVNLRPDAADNIIDEYLSKTDVGRIMLEADLQLKRDTASFTSPTTPEGRIYWDKLYKKAEELYGYDNVTIPTLTRPWIVPGEIIIRETLNSPSVYIYKATLKVMLESDYLKEAPSQDRGPALAAGNNPYAFPDTRSRALNEYSSQLIRELIIPKLTREVNSSKRYALLRQAYYSLILAQWFKARHKSQAMAEGAAISSIIDSNNLTRLTSQEPWSKTTYFKAYQKSFAEGEYNIKEPVYTPTGQSIRSYFSGGLMLGSAELSRAITGSSPVGDKLVIISPQKFTPSERMEEVVVSASSSVIEGPDSRVGPVASPAALYFDPDQAKAMDLLKIDSRAWVVFADMLKLSLRNHYYGKEIADIFIADAIRIAKKVLSRSGGIGFRLGDRSDEIAMVLPGSLKDEEIKKILQAVQWEIKKEYQNYYIARLPDGMVEQIKSSEGVREAQRSAREGLKGIGEYVTTVFFEKDSGDINGRSTLDRILKESGQSPGVGEVEEALPPYLPAGAAELQGSGDIESKLEASLKEAEILQRAAKEEGQMAGVKGLIERPQRKEGASLPDSVFSNIGEYRGKLEALLQPLREFAEKSYGDNAAKQVQLDNGYAAFMRKNLYLILRYAMDKMKSSDSFIFAVRGPPDNFYIVTASKGKWQVTAVRQNILTPEGSTLGRDFRAIITGSGRGLMAQGKFPFKVINDFDALGHYFGNQLIKLVNIYLLYVLNNQIQRDNNGILDEASISQALTAVSKNINDLLSEHGFGFSVSFEAVSVTSDDFSGRETAAGIAAKALDIIEKLNAASRTVDIPANSGRFYSQYRGRWQEVEEEIDSIAARRATNAKTGLDEAHRIFNAEPVFIPEEAAGDFALQAAGSSPLAKAPTQADVGGIDLRFLPIITQAMSNLQVSLHQGALSTKELLGINLIQEWQDIQKMVEAGIIPSTDRL
ncbi:MAG: hypothetical protein V1869_06780, partial [Candidatus Omnitrophota bacterium]